MKRRKVKKSTKIIIVISIIISFTVIAVVVYNYLSDYAVDLMFKLSTQTLIDQNEKDFKRQNDLINKDFEKRLRELKLQKDLDAKQRLDREKKLTEERTKRLKQLETKKKLVQSIEKKKVPEDVRKQIFALALKGLGADGVSRCLAMLSGGLTPEEKSELKELFHTKFSASEQKQILVWAALYTK